MSIDASIYAGKQRLSLLAVGLMERGLANVAGQRVRALGRWAHARIPLAAREAPVDLRLVGQTLLRATLIGAASGLFGALFFWITEHAQYWVLGRLVGYRPLRAAGEVLPGLIPRGQPGLPDWP
jgi:hypothetical protein